MRRAKPCTSVNTGYTRSRDARFTKARSGPVSGQKLFNINRGHLSKSNADSKGMHEQIPARGLTSSMPEAYAGMRVWVAGPGGRQILLEDPSGNLVELFEPARES